MCEICQKNERLFTVGSNFLCKCMQNSWNVNISTEMVLNEADAVDFDLAHISNVDLLGFLSYFTSIPWEKRVNPNFVARQMNVRARRKNPKLESQWKRKIVFNLNKLRQIFLSQIFKKCMKFNLQVPRNKSL